MSPLWEQHGGVQPFLFLLFSLYFVVDVQEDLDKVTKGNSTGNKRSNRRPVPSQLHLNQDTGSSQQ
jgi:hypothetical protein